MNVGETTISQQTYGGPAATDPMRSMRALAVVWLN
jgi:hypothetical protein